MMNTRNDSREQIRSLVDGLRRDLVEAGLGSGVTIHALRPASAQTCQTCGGRHDTDTHLARARGLQLGDEILVVNDAEEFNAHILEVDRGMVFFWAWDEASLIGLWYGSAPARNCYR